MARFDGSGDGTALTILRRKEGSKIICQKWTILSELIVGISSSCWRYEVGAGREHI